MKKTIRRNVIQHTWGFDTYRKQTATGEWPARLLVGWLDGWQFVIITEVADTALSREPDHNQDSVINNLVQNRFLPDSEIDFDNQYVNSSPSVDFKY